MRTLLIHSLFFLSGISGLVYQVVWVRQFGNVFGNTVYSAATVSAVFLCGLGIGSYTIGRWSDRSYQRDPDAPLRAYGLFEIGIAALGLIVAGLLPALEPLSAALSHYERGPEGWFELSPGSHAIRYLTAIALLTPITVLMGGTLTLLIRYFVARDVALAGWKIGALYGINTAGSALGAFLSDFSLIPEFGILGAQYCAIATNAFAGLAAIGLAGRRRSKRPPDLSEPPAEMSEPVGATEARRAGFTGLTLLVSGLVAMGMEILWFRFLITAVGPYRSVFSLLLTVILIGICLGSLLGGWLHRKYGRAAQLYFAAQALFVLSALYELAQFDHGYASQSLAALQRLYQEASPSGKIFYEFWHNFKVILRVVGAPALLMGCAFPLANANVQRAVASVGRRAGSLYLFNTVGNVCGSLLVGFVFLPLLGTHGSAWALAGLAVIGLLPLYLVHRTEMDRAGSWFARHFAEGCLLVMVAGVVAWGLLPSNHLLRSAVPPEREQFRVIALSEGINETVAVLKATNAPRSLYTNGHPMSSSHPSSQRYMRLFSHIALLQIDEPKRVLVICFGIGNTLHAASLHRSVEQLEVVDLSKNIMKHAHYFSMSNHNIIEDERVSVFINDGRHHLRMQADASYDLITLEPPPIASAGIASLYSREFYQLARAKLRDGGFMTQWLPGYQVSGEMNLSIIRAFIDVFPNAILLSGHLRNFILIGINGDTNQLDIAKIRSRIEADPRLERELAAISVESLTALVGTFISDAATLKQATRNSAAVTDDWPGMEYISGAMLFEMRLPESIFALESVSEWCPSCFRDGQPIFKLRQLPAYLSALDACYRGNTFLEFTRLGSSGVGRAGEMQLPADLSVKAAIRNHAYLKYVFLGPEYPNEEKARRNTPCAIPHDERWRYR